MRAASQRLGEQSRGVAGLWPRRKPCRIGLVFPRSPGKLLPLSWLPVLSHRLSPSAPLLRRAPSLPPRLFLSSSLEAIQPDAGQRGRVENHIECHETVRLRCTDTWGRPKWKEPSGPESPCAFLRSQTLHFPRDSDWSLPSLCASSASCFFSSFGSSSSVWQPDAGRPLWGNSPQQRLRLSLCSESLASCSRSRTDFASAPLSCRAAPTTFAFALHRSGTPRPRSRHKFTPSARSIASPQSPAVSPLSASLLSSQATFFVSSPLFSTSSSLSSSSSISSSSTSSSPSCARTPPERRLNIGERRRQDRLLNWFKQYPYAPGPPAPPKQKSTTKIDIDPAKISPAHLPLPSRRLPSSLRWKAVSETLAPSSVTAASADAAVSAAHEAVRTLQAGGMPRRRKGKNRKMKKIALARAAVAAAVAAHKAPGLAALKAAAESAEQLVSAGERGTGEDLHARGGVSRASETTDSASGSRDLESNASGTCPRTDEGDREKQADSAASGQPASLLSVLYPSRDAAYPPDLALFLVKQLSTAKFTETVELHVQLNLGTGTRGKARKGGGSSVAGRVRGFVTLPHGQLGQLSSTSKEQNGLGTAGENTDADAEMKDTEGEREEQTEEGTEEETEEQTGEKDSDTGPLGEGEGPEERKQTSREESAETAMATDGAGAAAKNGALLGGVVNEKPESGIVRGNKRGGIWRRKRVIAAFVDKKDEAAALEAGADVVGAERILEEIRTDKISFEILISTPDMVARLTRYGKILGPKDLMPQAAWGTLTADFAEAIRLYRQTTIPYKADRFNIVHMPIGWVSMSKEELRENLDAAIASINSRRPPTAGNKFLNKVHISSTMGPGIVIDMRHVKLSAASGRGQRGR